MDIGENQQRSVERLRKFIRESPLPVMQEVHVSKWTAFTHLPENRYQQDGRAVVVQTHTSGDLKADIVRMMDALGGFDKALAPGDRILMKPNCNSPDPPPASTDVEFLAAVAEVLQDYGYKNLAVGDSAGIPWHPTMDCFKKMGLAQRMERLGVQVLSFDTVPWMEVPVPGEHFQSICIPEVLTEFDKIIYLPCLKTHHVGRFTASLKLSVGFLHPAERPVKLHYGNMEEKVAELGLAVRPDLILLDARVVFKSRGPWEGECAHPGLLMASADQVATDVEGVKHLQSYPAENFLDRDAWELPQIQHAVSLGIGDSYVVRQV